MKSPDTELSNCCHAPMIVVGDSFGEGTNHYECMKCGNACDLAVIEPQNMQEKLASSISPTENTEELTDLVEKLREYVESEHLRKLNKFNDWEMRQNFPNEFVAEDELVKDILAYSDQAVQAFGEKVLKEVKQDFVHEESSVAFDEGRMYEQFRIGRVITSLLKGANQ